MNFDLSIKRLYSAELTIYVTLLLVSMGCIGCGPDSDGRVSVTGSVRYDDGSPVVGEAASVVFQPDSSSSNPGVRAASGRIEPDGTFELMTQKQNDGAHVGDYKVLVKVWKDYASQTPAPEVPKDYRDFDTTPLQATVSQEARHFDFVIER